MASSRSVSGPLMFVSGYVYRMLRQEARRAELRWTSILVLKDLDLLGALSQQQLADIEELKRSTMTVLLHELEDAGYVKRSVHTANRSANLVRITARGRRALRAAGGRFVDRIQAALEGVSARDLAKLGQGLTALEHLWMQDIEARRRSNRR
jgi:DNA-binding MarR family transcriptional regulator